jgi:spore germination protein KB
MIEQEIISLSQLFLLTVNFLLGSTVVFGIGSEAKNDDWIAIIVGAILGAGVIWSYHKCITLIPGKNLYQILEYCFGKVASIVLSFLFSIYFIYLASRVVRDVGELITAALMPNTPMEVISITFSLVIGYIIYLGLEVLARTTEIFSLYIFVFICLVTIFLFASGTVDIRRIQPTLGDGYRPILKAVFPNIITFPYGEMVAFFVILPYVSNTKKRLRSLMIGISIGSLLLVFASLLTICSLGVDTMERSNFPLLSVARIVSIGNFIERIDAFVVFIMLLTILIKSCIFFFAGLKGLEHIFKLPFRYFSLPMSMLVALFSILTSIGFADLVQEGLIMVPYYLHLPFQFCLPLLVFIMLKWKQRKSQ